MNAPELDKKINVSLSLLVGLVVASFTIGGVVSKLMSQEHEIQDVRHYIDAEVGGLRSDWERRYDDNINPRLEKLENVE